MTDPFKPLKTYEDTDGLFWMYLDRGQYGEADYAHIATWDPETCREVVGLLKLADGSSVEYCERLTALLERLGTP